MISVEILQKGSWVPADSETLSKIELTPNKHGGVKWISVLVHPGVFHPFRIVIPSKGKIIYKPHLTPSDDMVVSEEVFRSPVMITQDESIMHAMFPDFGDIEKPHPIPYFMNYDIKRSSFLYGMGKTNIVGHVYYQLAEYSFELNAPHSFSIGLIEVKNPDNTPRDFSRVSKLLFDLYGDERMNKAVSPSDLLFYAD